MPLAELPTAALAGSCPARTFMLGTTTVTTSETTTFDDMRCAGLVGLRVEVHGERQADGSVAARRIEPND